jgi:hypothetical protein
MSQVKLTAATLKLTTVFPDGQTFQSVRDAIIAAAMTGMWHVSHELAQRYQIENIVCLKCGGIIKPGQATYFTYRERAVRICLKCNGGGSTIPR